MCDTYRIHRADEVRAEHVGSVLDASTGAMTAYFTTFGGHAFSIPIGVDLCADCDAPVPEGFCPSCDLMLAPVERISPTQVAA